VSADSGAIAARRTDDKSCRSPAGRDAGRRTGCVGASAISGAIAACRTDDNSCRSPTGRGAGRVR